MQGSGVTIIMVMSGAKQLIAKLIYDRGLRLMEFIRLRVHGIDFSLNEVTVRDANVFKDRITMLPELVKPALSEHLSNVLRKQGIQTTKSPLDF